MTTDAARRLMAAQVRNVVSGVEASSTKAGLGSLELSSGKQFDLKSVPTSGSMTFNYALKDEASKTSWRLYASSEAGTGGLGACDEKLRVAYYLSCSRVGVDGRDFEVTTTRTPGADLKYVDGGPALNEVRFTRSVALAVESGTVVAFHVSMDVADDASSVPEFPVAVEAAARLVAQFSFSSFQNPSA